MTDRIQNIAVSTTYHINSNRPAPATPPQQVSGQVVLANSARSSDSSLQQILNPSFLAQLRRHPSVPANAAILRFATWVERTNPTTQQLAEAKLQLVRDLVATQRNWVGDVMQMSGAVARTLGGALMTSNSVASEWNGNNQQTFDSALFHLNDECESWVTRMSNLFRGNRHNFNQASEEAGLNDAALSFVRDLARTELNQTSSATNPIAHQYYSQLLNHDIPEISGTQQLASTLRSHSVLFARNPAEAATGIFGALACVGAGRIAQSLATGIFARAVIAGAFNGFLQVALQTQAHQGVRAIFTKDFAMQAGQAFATGAVCGAAGSLVGAAFGRLLGINSLATTNAAGEKMFRWGTARLFQRAITFGADVETEVRMDNAFSQLTSRRNIHNRLGMGQQVETTGFWNRVVGAAGEAAGDATSHTYSHAARSAYTFANSSAQEYGPQIRAGAQRLAEEIFKGPPSEMQMAFAGEASGLTVSHMAVDNLNDNILRMSGKRDGSAAGVTHNDFYTPTEVSLPRAVIMVGNEFHAAHCLEAILKARKLGKDGGLPLGDILVLSNAAPSQHVTTLIETYGITYRFLSAGNNPATRAQHDDWVAQEWKQFRPDFVVMAKYMFVLPEALITQMDNRILNLHHGNLPGLEGRFPVTTALQMGVSLATVSFHFAITQLDAGALIHQVFFPIDKAIDDYKENVVSAVYEYLVPQVQEAEVACLLQGLSLYLNQHLAVVPNVDYGRAHGRIDAQLVRDSRIAFKQAPNVNFSKLGYSFPHMKKSFREYLARLGISSIEGSRAVFDPNSNYDEAWDLGITGVDSNRGTGLNDGDPENDCL